MEEALQALKKLNVFAQMRPKPTGNAMFSKTRLSALSDRIFGVAMMLLILDIRPAGGFFAAGSRPSCLHVRIALWALALDFAGRMIRVWSKRAAALD